MVLLAFFYHYQSVMISKISVRHNLYKCLVTRALSGQNQPAGVFHRRVPAGM